MSKTVYENIINDNYSDNNITFIIKHTKSCVPVVTLSVTGKQNLSKLLSKEFASSAYWNGYKTKRKN